MGNATRRIIIAGTILIGFLAFYQTLIGNPFFDEVSPVPVFIIAAAMPILILIAIRLEKKRKAENNSN